MRKSLLCLAAALCLTAAGCSAGEDAAKAETIKIGLVAAADSGHGQYLRNACSNKGISQDGISVADPEGLEDAYEVFSDMAKDGCRLIFAVGEGYENCIGQVADENPDTQFCLADYDAADYSRWENIHTYTVGHHELRYLEGVAAGYMLNDLIANELITAQEAVLGYTAREACAASVSDYTAFYLGAGSVCESAELLVHYYGDAQPGASAKLLCANGCQVVSGDTVDEAQLQACSYVGVRHLTQLVSAEPDYTKAYEHFLSTLIEGEPLPEYYVGESRSAAVIAQGFVSPRAAEQAQAGIDAAIKGFGEKRLHVFDTAEFTVGGERLTAAALQQDGSDMAQYISANGYFMEYELGTAARFDFIADGVSEINGKNTAYNGGNG